MRLITSIRAAACPRCRAHGHGHNSGTATPGGPRRARSTRPAPRPAMHWRPAAARTGSTARQHRLPRRDSTPRATTGRGATPEDQQCIAAVKQGRPTGPSDRAVRQGARQGCPAGSSDRAIGQRCQAALWGRVTPTPQHWADRHVRPARRRFGRCAGRLYGPCSDRLDLGSAPGRGGGLGLVPPRPLGDPLPASCLAEPTHQPRFRGHALALSHSGSC